VSYEKAKALCEFDRYQVIAVYVRAAVGSLRCPVRIPWSMGAPHVYRSADSAVLRLSVFVLFGEIGFLRQHRPENVTRLN
jgi:hypothetical protein